MTDTNTKLKLAEAAKVSGVSTNTLNRAKKAGKVSVELIDGIAHYEASELARVYQKTFDYNRLKISNDDKTNSTEANKNLTNEKVNVKVLEAKLTAAEEMLAKEKNERKNEIAIYESQIDDLKAILKESQSNETRLIEYNEEGKGDKLNQIVEPLKKELSTLRKMSESEKEKIKDLKISNTYFRIILAITVAISVVGFAIIQLDIIQLN